MNRYYREYYLSANKKYRITVDHEIEYNYASLFNLNYLKSIKDNKIILELKYNVSNDVDIEIITNHFNFRLSKNSKYINGIESIMY